MEDMYEEPEEPEAVSAATASLSNNDPVIPAEHTSIYNTLHDVHLS